MLKIILVEIEFSIKKKSTFLLTPHAPNAWPSGEMVNMRPNLDTQNYLMHLKHYFSFQRVALEAVVCGGPENNFIEIVCMTPFLTGSGHVRRSSYHLKAKVCKHLRAFEFFNY